MRPVLCFGEALIDFLNFNHTDDGLLTLKEYRQYPGGAPANAAVAIAKLGGKSLFAGQVGQDSFGDFLQDCLIKYGVDTSLLSRHKTASTALAFVMLDETGDRSFTFYRQNTADLLFSQDDIDDAWFANEAILHFCSNTLTENSIAECTKVLINKARDAGSVVSFDVNLRHNLWANGVANCELVNQLVYQSDIIKYAKDELEFLALGDIQGYLKDCFNRGVKLIIVTDGEAKIHIYTASADTLISPPKVTAIDTTAGGDAFIGAFLYGISVDKRIVLTDMARMAELVKFASHCGAIAVTRPGAFPALPQFSEVSNYWHDQT